MKIKILTIIVLFSSIILQSFQCGRPVDRCANYTQDTVLLGSSVTNSRALYHIGDTIWISSVVSDNLIPLSGAPSFNFELNQLLFSAQPYSIKNNATLPELQYANIEFNPVVAVGQLQNNGYGSYSFLYKRTTAINSLRIGFVAGCIGLYAMDCSNSQYYYNGGSLSIYKPNDYCTTYWGLTNFTPTEQNKNYWDSIGVAAVSLAPNYGNVTIAKNERNYFLFKVVP